jgi:UDP-N-acetylglucosamine pyrophosphorylase
MNSNLTEADTIPIIEKEKQAKKIDVDYFKQSFFPRVNRETSLPIANKV